MRPAVQGRVHFGALLTAFGLIFLAELPDKTAYTVLLLASRSRPVPVLLGSWAAFLAQGFVAVALGSLLARLPPQAVTWSAAALLLAFGLMLLLSRDAEEEPPPPSHRKAFVEAFVLVFLAEMGDATQIGTAALVARLGARWSVLIGSTLALWTVAALAVTVGATVGPRLPRRTLRRVAGALFIVFAVGSVLLARIA
jgi:putative Ca2+/H+ antiporter (TMEM165/GDT1 family)